MIYLAFLVGVLLGFVATYFALPIYEDWAYSRAVDVSPEVEAFMAAFPEHKRS